MAVPLLTMRDDFTLKVSEEAARVLHRASNKIAVVSIFGETKSGKSALLNQLLGAPDAFKVKKSSKLKSLIDPKSNVQDGTPFTKGLWIYAEPLTIEKEGEAFDIFFIDSEGLLPPQPDTSTTSLEESKISPRPTVDAADLKAEKHRMLLSIMIGISSHIIYNGSKSNGLEATIK